MTRIITLLIFLWLSLVGNTREIDSFINITTPGVYDFQGEVLYLKEKSNSPAIVIGDVAHENPSFVAQDITLRNVVIFGMMDNQTSEYNGVYPYLRNNGITIRGARNVTIENVWVVGARSGGIVTEKHSDNITVRNSFFVSNFFDGIAACETTNSLFENVVTAGNHYAGISLDWFVKDSTFRGILSWYNRDWTAFQRLSTGIRYEHISSYGNGGGIYLAPNLESSERTSSTATTFSASFSDLRAHFIAACCTLSFE